MECDWKGLLRSGPITPVATAPSLTSPGPYSKKR
jgi:hypothetical protein